ncbi:MAG: lytic murein transglycosylase, partial [Calditrichaeota bacterium]|nr:lytic murein transglycosylase [Calditrichota bacterium]
MKIWLSVGIVIALMAAYSVKINSSLLDNKLSSLNKPPSDEEEMLILEIPDNDSAKRSDKDSTFKVIESDTSDLQIDDRYVRILLETLTDAGWESNDINMIRKYLMDPRAEFQPTVLNRNSTHQETKEQYEQYLTKQSVDRCMTFWKSHGEEVTAAISSYDVPPEIIVAILKVESNFGKHKGRQTVFNVFWSLSIGDNPEIMNDAITTEGTDAKQQRKRLQKRARWGRSQLYELINLVTDLNNEEILWEASSWAGAFGLPQFIPASFRAYARDGNNDGKIDLNNISDAA